MTKVRVDKWLWAVRAYKSRTVAANACSNGKVKIDDEKVKASRLIEVGETIQFSREGQKKIYKVLDLLEKRVSAKEAQKYFEDLSPPEIPSRKIPSAFVQYPAREKGSGRPTKRERRDLDKWKGKF